VMSGFRCGDWFAVNRHGVVPDMIVMAKGLTSGYVPMGGVLVRENLISPQFDNKPLSVGLTYAAHPIGCAAAATAIEIYQEKRLILKSLDLEFWLRSALHQRLRHIACVGDIRTTGFLATIELVIPGTHQPLVAWNSSDMTWPQRISSGLWAAGIIPMVRWNYLFVAPPLIATQAQLLDVIDQLGNILDVVSSEMNGLISENS
jgi:taurine--2-oxoglutarate transaminase